MSTFKAGSIRETQIRINLKIHPSSFTEALIFFLRLECSARQLISSWILVLCSLRTESVNCDFFSLEALFQISMLHQTHRTCNLTRLYSTFCCQGALKLLLQVVVMTEYSPLFAYNAFIPPYSFKRKSVFFFLLFQILFL